MHLSLVLFCWRQSLAGRKIGFAAAVPHVELIVRAHVGDTGPLLALLRSAELFWPYPVCVVLDEDSTDWASAELLPSSVRIAYDPAPRGFARWTAETRGSGRSSKGFSRAQWGYFRADLISNASFLALTDADSLFSAPVTDEVLFRSPGVPIMRGVGRPVFWWPMVALGWPWVADKE